MHSQPIVGRRMKRQRITVAASNRPLAYYMGKPDVMIPTSFITPTIAYLLETRPRWYRG